MRTLNITISESEYARLGLTMDDLSFADFVEIISRELNRQNLSSCLEVADKYGISKMTMNEITDEVKAVRRDAKNRN